MTYPVPMDSGAQWRLEPEVTLNSLFQIEAQLYEHCDPAEVTGRTGDMLIVSPLTLPGQHGVSTLLCSPPIPWKWQWQVTGAAPTVAAALRSRPYALLMGSILAACRALHDLQGCGSGWARLFSRKWKHTSSDAVVRAFPRAAWLPCSEDVCSRPPRCARCDWEDGRTVMAGSWRNCLLQMANWELSTSAEMKSPGIGKKETGEWGSGWWELPLRYPRCPWLFCHCVSGTAAVMGYCIPI